MSPTIAPIVAPPQIAFRRPRKNTIRSTPAIIAIIICGVIFYHQVTQTCDVNPIKLGTLGWERLLDLTLPAQS